MIKVVKCPRTRILEFQMFTHFLLKNVPTWKKTRVFAVAHAFGSKRGSLDFQVPPNRLPKTKKHGKKLDRGNDPRSVFEKDVFSREFVY